MKYKLIACDFDSTLSKSDRSVSDKTINIVHEYMRKGGIFSISTGRNEASAKKGLEMLGIENDTPFIICQGAIIKTPKSDKVIREKRLSKETSRDITTIFSDCYVQVYYENEIFCNTEKCGFKDSYTAVTGVEPVYKKSFEGILGQGYHKIIIADFSEGFQKNLSVMREKYKGVAEFRYTGEGMLEIYSYEAGKGNAVAFLADYYNIPLENVMTFGDSSNDISMLEVAGMGVAVGNAFEKVKLAADYVTESNDDDGVAKAIEKFCF